MLVLLVVACLPLSLGLSPPTVEAPLETLPKEGRTLTKEDPVEGPASKSLLDLFNPFSIFKKLLNEGDDAATNLTQIIHPREAFRREQCHRIPGGKLVNDECYAYFNDVKSFEEAKTFCENKGAKLWTPDLRDAFLFTKMAQQMPEIFAAPNHEILLNVLFETETGLYTDGDDQDVSDAYLILMDADYADFLTDVYGYEGSLCIYLSFPTGEFVTRADFCIYMESPVVCEFPLEDLEDEGSTSEADTLLSVGGVLIKKGK